MDASLLSTPLGSTAALAAAVAALCWVLQFATGFFSYVDMLWSVLPAVYAVMLVPLSGDWHDARTVLLAALIVVWGARLTYNFYRKGGYAGEEDYRWAVVRGVFKRHDPCHPLAQELFSCLFISVYQLLLIWAFSALPVWQTTQFRSPLNAGDAVCAAVALAALAAETWADEVQFAFQSAKHSLSPAERLAAGGDFARGFCTAGPFRYSRHLNFFGEQLFWVAIYGFTVAAGAPVVSVAGAGAAALVLLFQGSTWLTEALSCARHPAYAAYQRTTSRLLPWLPGPSLDSLEGERIVRRVAACAASAAE